MVFDIITLFPESFSYLNTSILKKAQEKKIIKIRFWNPRDFAKDKREVDDKPYGGGPGMVLKFEPIYKALEKAKKTYKTKKRKIILTHPAGKIFNQNLARELSKEKQIIIICGHYEGIDARIEKFVDLKISVGKYILTGGELPAMIFIDAITRHLPGALHHPLSLEEKRSNQGLYSYPVYTRPEIIIIKRGLTRMKTRINADNKFSKRGLTRLPTDKSGTIKLKVPKVLLSGNHKLIEDWRKKHSKKII
jgi:tRNA (guanine37-N1)-methyltransferase